MATQCKQYTVTVPGTTDSLSILRNLVLEAARRAELSELESCKLEIAVCEACANIVEHSYRGAQDKHIKVTLEIHPTRVVVTINDQSSESFPVTKMEIITVDEFLASNRKRGLGTYIIRNFVDKVEHSFSPKRGNRLRLTKFR